MADFIMKEKHIKGFCEECEKKLNKGTVIDILVADAKSKDTSNFIYTVHEGRLYWKEHKKECKKAKGKEKKRRKKYRKMIKKYFK